MRARTGTAQRIASIVAGDDGDPYSFLGMHEAANGLVIRAFLPDASRVTVLRKEDGQLACELKRLHKDGY